MDNRSNNNEPMNEIRGNDPYYESSKPRRRWGLWVGIIILAALAVMFTRNITGGGTIRISERDIPSFSSVNIITSSANIEFIPANYFGIEIHMPRELQPEWNVENNVLIFRQTNRTNINVGLFRINERRYVRVYYPRGTSFDEVLLQANSGNVTFPEAETRNLTITTSSGNITAGAENYINSALTASSGNINFEGNCINGQTDISASSGNITVNNRSNQGQMNISASSGNVRANVSDAAEVMVSTSSGNITSTLNNIAVVSLSASSGNIETSVDGSDAANIRTSSGNISVDSDDTTATNLTANATSGRIRVEGGTWQDLTAESSSGNIDISGALLGNTSARATSGRVELDVRGQVSQYGYDLNATSSSATIRWDGNRMDRPARSSGSFEHNISVNTSSGNIRVDFD